MVVKTKKRKTRKKMKKRKVKTKTKKRKTTKKDKREKRTKRMMMKTKHWVKNCPRYQQKILSKSVITTTTT